MSEKPDPKPVEQPKPPEEKKEEAKAQIAPLVRVDQANKKDFLKLCPELMQQS